MFLDLEFDARLELSRWGPSFWGFPMFDRLPDWLRKELTSFIKYDGLPLGAVRGRGYCDLQRISKIKNTAFSPNYMENSADVRYISIDF